MTPAELVKYNALLAEKAALEAQLAAKNTFGALRLKISAPRPAGTKADGSEDKGSEGGAVSIYNLGRFPVTLYKEQMERLIGKMDDDTDLGFVPEIKKFMRENRALLKTKAPKTAKAA